MITRKIALCIIAAIAFFTVSVISANEINELITSGKEICMQSWIHVLFGVFATLMIYFAAREHWKNLSCPITSKKKRLAIMGIGTIVFALLCGGCATDLIMYIENGTSHTGNDIFHSVTGAICVCLAMEFVRTLR